MNKYDQRNNYDARSQLDNSLRSNISYTRRFATKPYSLQIGLNHSQNSRTREVEIRFPSLNFNIPSFQPFKRKKVVGDPKWYEQINVNYSLAANNRYTAYDTTFLNSFNANNLNYGLKHTASVNATYSLFKYVRLNLSSNLGEFWHFKRIHKSLKDTLSITEEIIDIDVDSNVITRMDTTFGIPQTDTIHGFYTFSSIQF